MLPTFKLLRLTLRPLVMADAERMQAYASDWDVARMLASVPHPYPAGEAAGFIAEMIEEPADGLPVRVFAIDHEGFIGTVAITSDLMFRAGPVGIGYWTGRPHWGKGYTTEAVRGLLKHYVFGELDLDEVTSGMFTDNLASWRIQEKLGFERIGESAVTSLARGVPAPHWNTRLTRAAFRKSAT